MERMTYFLMVRLNKEMEIKLKQMAEESNKSLADFVRQSLFTPGRLLNEKSK